MTLLHYYFAVLIPVAFIGISVLMLVRNAWVHDMRASILEDSRWNSSTSTHIEYARLPSYHTMLWQFWKWEYEEVFDDGLWNDIGENDWIYKHDPETGKLIVTQMGTDDSLPPT